MGGPTCEWASASCSAVWIDNGMIDIVGCTAHLSVVVGMSVLPIYSTSYCFF